MGNFFIHYIFIQYSIYKITFPTSFLPTEYKNVPYSGERHKINPLENVTNTH